jgi:hypothetical protein
MFQSEFIMSLKNNLEKLDPFLEFKRNELAV